MARSTVENIYKEVHSSMADLPIFSPFINHSPTKFTISLAFIYRLSTALENFDLAIDLLEALSSFFGSLQSGASVHLAH